LSQKQRDSARVSSVSQITEDEVCRRTYLSFLCQPDSLDYLLTLLFFSIESSTSDWHFRCRRNIYIRPALPVGVSQGRSWQRHGIGTSSRSPTVVYLPFRNPHRIPESCVVDSKEFIEDKQDVEVVFIVVDAISSIILGMLRSTVRCTMVMHAEGYNEGARTAVTMTNGRGRGDCTCRALALHRVVVYMSEHQRLRSP